MKLTDDVGGYCYLFPTNLLNKMQFLPVQDIPPPPLCLTTLDRPFGSQILCSSTSSRLLPPTGSSLTDAPASWCRQADCFPGFSHKNVSWVKTATISHTAVALAPDSTPGTRRCSVHLWSDVSVSPPSEARRWWWEARPVVRCLA